MTSMTDVIVPKSDQWNADDFIAGPKTFTIRDVSIKPGEQPVNVFFEGGDKAYRPCKSMCRVLVQAWGKDAKEYIGRSLTLYRDPAVKWAGMEIGGIRISHMSHIDGKIQMPLAVARGTRKMFVISPLETDPTQQLLAQARREAAYGRENFAEYWKRLSKQQQIALKPFGEELRVIAEKAIAAEPASPDREPGDE